MTDALGPEGIENDEDTAAVASAGMGRASAVLAAGTVVSRVLGFARTAMLAAVIGTATAGNAFAIGNQLPNNIYALIAGGVLSAVLVPQIVRAATHADGGQRYINRMVTLGAVLFAAITIIATLAAPALVNLYASQSSSGRGFTPEAIALATAFAYWCLPQIFFYAMYSLLSEVLNARKVFGPFTWAPVLNNVVSIAGLVLFLLLFGAKDANGAVGDWDTAKIVLLGGTTTLAIVAQALVLFLFWRRAGLHFRPDFHWRGVGLRATGKSAGWLFGMVLVTQIAGVFQSRTVTLATDSGASTFVLANAWLLIMLPFSVIAVSIVTAYFTRMSGHASAGDTPALRLDVSESLRSIGLLMVFATVVLAVVAYPFSRFFETGFGDVSAMGNVVLAFAPGLILYTVLFVLQRVFYSLGDTRTPFLAQCIQSALFIAGALACMALPAQWIAVGIAAVTSLTFSIQAIIVIVLVSRRIGGMDGRLVFLRYVQFLGFAVLSGVVGLVLLYLLGGTTPDGFALSGRLQAAVAMVAIAGAMGIVYLGLLVLFRNPELGAIIRTVRARFGR